MYCVEYEDSQLVRGWFRVGFPGMFAIYGDGYAYLIGDMRYQERSFASVDEFAASALLQAF